MSLELGHALGKCLKEEHKEEMHVGGAAFDLGHSRLWDVFLSNFGLVDMPSLGETLRDELGGHIETKIGPRLEMTLLFPDLGDPLQDKFGGYRNTWLSGVLRPLPRASSEALDGWMADRLPDTPFTMGSFDSGVHVVREHLKGALNEFQVTWPAQFGTLYWVLWIRIGFANAMREAVRETL